MRRASTGLQRRSVAVLRAGDGPPQTATEPVLPVAAGRVVQRTQLGARHGLARRRFARRKSDSVSLDGELTNHDPGQGAAVPRFIVPRLMVNGYPANRRRCAGRVRAHSVALVRSGAQCRWNAFRGPRSGIRRVGPSRVVPVRGRRVLPARRRRLRQLFRPRQSSSARLPCADCALILLVFAFEPPSWSDAAFRKLLAVSAGRKTEFTLEGTIEGRFGLVAGLQCHLEHAPVSRLQ
jgi:hypothetical protein